MLLPLRALDAALPQLLHNNALQGILYSDMHEERGHCPCDRGLRKDTLTRVCSRAWWETVKVWSENFVNVLQVFQKVVVR